MLVAVTVVVVEALHAAPSVDTVVAPGELFVAAGMLAFEIWRAKAKNLPQIERSPFEPRVIAVLAAVVVWTGAYYLAFVPLGYILATSIYLLPLMAGFNPRKWIANIATAVLFAAGTYWLFGKLEVALPKGILPI